MKIAVAGALGRMGRLTYDIVRTEPDFEYAGGFARSADADRRIYDDVDELIAAERPQILVDYTSRPTTQSLARKAVEAGISPVIGSSEWSAPQREALRALCDERGIGALLVPNFAVGAVLMMRFAEQAALLFPTIEIVELHRADKRDKPSGTAAATAERIRAAGGPAEVPIHSVRLRGLVSHQEVLCGNEGELLTLRHDSFSERSFAAGIVLALRRVRELRGLHVGLDELL